MEHEEFRVKAKEMIDYVADYLENIRDRRVCPNVQPGYLHRLLPDAAPEDPEPWDHIFEDVDKKVVPGLVHWPSPHMHAYFPANNSYPSILGEILCAGFNSLCFTWASSPAGTELETIAMNWLGKAIGLPDSFLSLTDHSTGGGIMQGTASEATLVCLLAARTRALIALSKENPDLQSSELLGHLICYCSDQAHSSVEKAGLISLVRIRYIESDEHQSMRGPKLEEAILADKEKGLVPFWVCATLGTTGTVAFDNLREIGEVCERHNAWLHVDAAYAGSAFVCPEYRHWLDGIELADSFAFNPSKWLLVNADCNAMWVKDSTALHRTFNVNPIYLRHENSGKAIDYMIGNKKNDGQGSRSIINTFNSPKKTKELKLTNVHVKANEILNQNGIKINGDYIQINGDDIKINGDDIKINGNGVNGNEDDLYEDGGQLHGYNKIAPGCGENIQLEDPNKKEFLHWQIPLTRRFRALKVWFVLRSYGISGLRKHINEGVRLAQKFQALVLSDHRFEIPQPSNLGLVAFRLKGPNVLTERLLKKLNSRGFIHAVPACFKNTYVIRFTITSPKTTNQDIVNDWNEIKTVASEILKEEYDKEDGNIVQAPARPRISLKETRKLNEAFGTSLLLANSPMSPKIVNGTHVALCDYEQVLASCAHTFPSLKLQMKDSPEMRRRIRGMKMCGQKFSLDSCMDMVQGLMMDHFLPLHPEEEKEELSSTGDGSSPGEKSSRSSSPVTSTSTMKPENSENLLLPPLSKQYRSKSVDLNLGNVTFEDVKITIDMENTEVIITPDDFKSFADDDDQKVNQFYDKNNGDQSQTVSATASDYHLTESKITIKGPGCYIKKLIQQFSEGPFEDDNFSTENTPLALPEGEKAEKEGSFSSLSLKEKASAICKKCLHVKGKVTK